MENSMKNNDEIEIDLRQIFIVIMSNYSLSGSDFRSGGIYWK